MTVNSHTSQLIAVAAQAASDKLASDMKMIDVRARMPLSEAFMICSASSARQVSAIAENIMDELAAQLDLRPERIEGRTEGHWVLIDYADVVIHVLTDEDREYYALESLWADQPITELDADRDLEALGA